MASLAASQSLLTRFAILDRDARRDAAARAKIGYELQRAWRQHRDQIIQDAVRYVFVEDPLVAEALQVELQTFQLDTFFVGRISDAERAEVRLARFRTNGSELGTHDLDHIIAVRKLVGKGFQLVAEVVLNSHGLHEGVVGN